jgi:uncharacterized protein
MTNQPPKRPRFPSYDEPLLQAADKGVFVAQRCSNCEHVPNYPRVACPHCFGTLEWVEVESRATVLSYAVVRRPHHERFQPYVPIVLALVELEGGGELITTIVGDDRLQTKIGDGVTHVPEAAWAGLPQFQLQA